METGGADNKLFHQKLSIGDPNGDYRSWSFGPVGEINTKTMSLNGRVYEDKVKGGDIVPGTFRETTPEQDEFLVKKMFEFQARPNIPYSVATQNCRWFSNGVARNLAQNDFGTAADPPKRTPLPPEPE